MYSAVTLNGILSHWLVYIKSFSLGQPGLAGLGQGETAFWLCMRLRPRLCIVQCSQGGAAASAHGGRP